MGEEVEHVGESADPCLGVPQTSPLESLQQLDNYWQWVKRGTGLAIGWLAGQAIWNLGYLLGDRLF